MSKPSGVWTALIMALLLTAGILGAAWYGRLTVGISGEYYNIAKAVYAGRGFADPFGAATGPTAWQAPLLPSLQAALLWLSDGAHARVVRVLVVLHLAVLIGTALLVIAIARQTCGRAGAIGAACALAIGLL